MESPRWGAPRPALPSHKTLVNWIIAQIASRELLKTAKIVRWDWARRESTFQQVNSLFITLCISKTHAAFTRLVD